MNSRSPLTDLSSAWSELDLLPNHVQVLERRGIHPEVARERGVYSVKRKQQLADLGFSRNQLVTPSLVIPSYNALGERSGYVNRPDRPRSKDNRLLRYEFPYGGQVSLDVPPRVKSQLIDPKVRLVVTEGGLKADSGASHGLKCIAIWGVWSFARHPGPLIDWDNVALRGCDVFLAFDSDVVTKRPVHQALERLRDFLKHRHASVYVVHLSPSSDGGKVGLDDYLAEGNNPLSVFELADHELPPLVPDATGDDGRSILDVGEQDLAVVTPAAWKALVDANRPPYLFQHGNELVRLSANSGDGLDLKALRVPDLRYELTRSARCVRYRQEEDGVVEVAARPDDKLVENMAVTPDPPLPEVDRVLAVPVFNRDGTLMALPGYHPESRTYYAPCSGLSVPEVPSAPTEGDVASAVALVAELLADFPFSGQADKAHAIALMLLPFVRELIDGPSPNHLIEAPEAGTGKTLLAEASLLPAVGRTVATMAQARTDEEWRKRITSVLRRGPDAVLIDNVRGVLDSGVLAAALTARIWEDRLLGHSDMLRLPVRCAWVTTGNNLELSAEIVRRSVRIRLDAKQDRPWQRKNFRHPNLLEWADDNRSALVWSLLTLTQAWIARGRPSGSGRTMGSYDQWARVIGGILDTAGVKGFLENLDALYERADTEGRAWRQFVAAWWQQYEDRSATTAELLRLAREIDGLNLRGETERGQLVSLGRLLTAQEDRVLDRYQIVRKIGPQRASRWQLAYVWPSETSEFGEDSDVDFRTEDVGVQYARSYPDLGRSTATFTRFSTFTSQDEQDRDDLEEYDQRFGD